MLGDRAASSQGVCMCVCVGLLDQAGPAGGSQVDRGRWGGGGESNLHLEALTALHRLWEGK